MTESLTLYKLIVLYMLKNSSAPLTNGQISEFVLGHEYTDYITLQQAIAEVIDSDLARVEESKNNRFYHITDQGEESLSFFKEKISPAIIEDINEYINNNKLSIINNAALIVNYYKSTGNGYDVNLKIREKNQIIMDLTINVDTKAEAELVCKNFKDKNQDLYSYIVKSLLM